MPLWVQWVTFGIAVVGATLGLFNAYWSVRRDSVRIRVRFVTLIVPSDDAITTGIEVINLGGFPVTITEVAVTGKAYGTSRGVLTSDYFHRYDLPFRLEPRSEITIASAPDSRDTLLRLRPSHCQATTACGIVARAKIRYEGRLK